MRPKILGGLIIIIVTLFACLSSGMAASASDVDIHRALPDSVDPDKKYLFYIHGAWIEFKGLDEPHPIFGLYEYEKIVDTFSQKDFTVISEVRLKKTGSDYVGKLFGQVRRLLEMGARPENITITGHSKGGFIALLLASGLNQPRINFVILAGCGKKGTGFRLGYDLFLKRRASRLKGRILSIYDSSDRIADSCGEAFQKATGADTDEIVLHTKKGHGLFFSPAPEWIDEVVKWGGNRHGK